MAERRRSVRFRITAVATAAVVVVLSLTGWALVVRQRRALLDDLDEGLLAASATLAAAIGAGDVPPVLGGFGDGDAVAQVVDIGTGRVVASTPNVAGRRPLSAPPPGSAPALRTVEHVPHDDARFRLVVRRVGADRVALVGSGIDDIDESTRVLSTSVAVAVPAAAVVLAALVWWLVGRTLRPVEAIRIRVAEIGGDDLSRRVPEPGTGDEVDRLARTMNAMLDRLAASAARQQRFVADASHELRSPLTRMRTELEVDGAAAAVTESVLEEVASMQRLVDDLLHLARQDADSIPRRSQSVDLDDLVLRAATRLRAERPSMVVDTAAVSAAQVLGDQDQLGRAVRNLLDNAGRHASSTVTVSLAEEGGLAVLRIADDGPGIPESERERIFERFTRLDAARQADAGGAGLGLAITRGVVQAHGGEVTLEGRSTFVVRLPSAPG